MTFRSLLLLGILIAAGSGPAPAQSLDDAISSPVLRAEVNVTGDVVRIGDVIDNAGPAAQIAIYRAPDLGTSGKLPVAQVLTALRAHRVIGVETHDINEISVTRLARTLEAKDIETQIASALEHRGGLGDAANLSLTFDRDVQTMQLDASNTGAMQLVANRFEPRSGRFDLTFEIGNDAGLAVTRLRFTGTAIETVEAAVLARGVERGEILKSSDVIVERRPKAEVGNDFAGRESRGRNAGTAAIACRPGAADRRSRQGGSRATRSAGDAGLPVGRALSHHPRQGAGGRHRRRCGERAEPAIEAHGFRHRDRPRPGQRRRADTNRTAPVGCERHIRRKRHHRHGWQHSSRLGRHQRQRNRIPKSRVTYMFMFKFVPHNRLVLSVALLATASLASGCSGIDRLAAIGEKPALAAIDNPTTRAGLQAGADADAEAGSGVLQRQLAVAERFAGVLQGSARRTRSATSSPSPSTSPTRPISPTRPSAAAPARKISASPILPAAKC